MAQMLGRPRNRGALGENWPCDCRQCRAPGAKFRPHRRWAKRRERQRWRRELRR